MFCYGQSQIISASLYSVNGKINASCFNAAYIKPSRQIKVYVDSNDNTFTLIMRIFVDTPAFSFYISHFFNLNAFEVRSTDVKFIEAESLPNGGFLLT